MIVQQWLHDPVIYRSMMKNGFRIMEDMSHHQIIFLIKSVCEKNQLETMKLMVENGLKFDWWYYPDDEYIYPHSTNVLTTALRYVKDDQLDIIKCLVEAAGADVINSGREKMYCFHMHYSKPICMAFSRNLRSTVLYLIEKGAIIDKENIADCGRSMDKETIKMMIQHYKKIHGGIDSTAVLEILREAFCSFSHCRQFDEFNGTEEKNFKMALKAVDWLLTVLVHSGMDINAPRFKNRVRDGSTLAHVFDTTFGLGDKYHFLFLSIFRKHGLDIDRQNDAGQTILHGAVRGRYFNTIKYLLKHRANINIPDKKGRIPIHMIFDIENYKKSKYPTLCADIIGLLVENGANFEIPDNSEILVKTRKSQQYRKLRKNLFERLFHFEMERSWSPELCSLLNKGEVYIKELPYVAFNNLKLYQWSSICVLLQAGSKDENLLKAALEQCSRKSGWGYTLLRHADPSFFQKALRDARPGADGPPTKEVIADANSVFSLIGWSVHSVRSHLFKVTRGRSILPRLRKLAQPPLVPRKLADVVTLDQYAVRGPSDMLQNFKRCF